MTPETKARQQIDKKLEQAGWAIQDSNHLKLSAFVGVCRFRCHYRTNSKRFSLTSIPQLIR